MQIATIRSCLLGIFLLWQLWFITTSNLAHLFGNSSGPDAIQLANRRWAEITCQHQGGWRQYSPSITRQSVFVAVELQWGDGSPAVELLSPLEPSDPLRYLQSPGISRLGFYEGTLDWQMWGWNTQTITAEPERYRRQMAEHIRGCWRSLKAYLHWRWQEYHRTHPALSMPTMLVLRARLYAMPAPDCNPWHWQEPEDLPIAAWRLGWQPPAGALPLEMYDPTSRSFVPLTEGSPDE